MGNAFYRRKESDFIPALMDNIPMVSSILGLLRQPQGKAWNLAEVLGQMDTNVFKTLAKQIAPAVPLLEELLSQISIYEE
ncbi:MAG: hypothetical protein QM451_01960 [Bacillota bacterium]|jgi:hypothetical protein|nr:hypothetical protein [Bacillota bacterium]HHT89357.1 hypothetical protein [Bacillota bacterium]